MSSYREVTQSDWERLKALDTQALFDRLVSEFGYSEEQAADWIAVEREEG